MKRAGQLVARSALKPDSPVENETQLVLGDTASSVNDGEDGLGSLVDDLDDDSAFDRVLEGVAEQVEDDLLVQLGTDGTQRSAQVNRATGEDSRHVDGLALRRLGRAIDDELDASSLDGRAEQ